MNRAHHIAGDWGISRLRPSLRPDDRVIGTRRGPGIGARREPAALTLRALVAGWRDTHGALPVVLCGMAGSRNGWRDTPYLPRPADLQALRREGIPASCLDGEHCALAGLRTLWQP